MGLLRRLFADYGERDFLVRLWNGAVLPAAPGLPERFTLVLNHPGALRRMYLPPSELGLAEAFVRGDFDVEGDLVACTALAELIGPLLANPLRWPPLLRGLAALPDTAATDGWRVAAHLEGRVHSRDRDRKAITYHYDLPAEFYALFLGRQMQYSCAYFPTGAEGIEAAQEAKLDHICRKLRLAPGERLLDIGCGWGGLVAHAAERYGVDATGITISQAQADWARQRIDAAGLGQKCRVEVRDYRDVREWRAFDKIVSVGMFEHVGRAKLPLYFERAFRLLRPGGLFLNHGIAGMYERAPNAIAELAQRLLYSRGGFMGKYVFPDGELVPVSHSNTVAEQVGFEVRDVESLREHYALTLRHWLRGLEARREEAVRLVGEPTYRVRRLFMAGCSHFFAAGHLNVYQTLMVKADRGRAGLPWTRADLYA
jgi:cyclopropane-fatty-acyl-phospholipid synthase